MKRLSVGAWLFVAANVAAFLFSIFVLSEAL